MTKHEVYNEDWFRSHSTIDSNGCWIWNGSKSRGYGYMNRLDYRGPVHIWAYICLVGPVPDSLALDHVYAWGCRSRACINVAHLEPVTGQINVLRGTAPSASNAVKAHCPAGHPYTDKNTRPNRKGRECRTCARVWRREQYRRDQAKIGRVIKTRVADGEVRVDAEDFLIL